MSDPTDGSASGIATLDEIEDSPQSGAEGTASLDDIAGSKEQLAVDVDKNTPLGFQGASLPKASGSLNLGAAPPKAPDLASQLVSEQRERRAAQYPVGPVSTGAGATPEQVNRLTPSPVRLSGGAQPFVNPTTDIPAVPVPIGPKFTNPGKASPQEAASDIAHIKDVTGYGGYGKMRSGFDKLVPTSTQPYPTGKEALSGAAELTSGALEASTPLMAAGGIAAATSLPSALRFARDMFNLRRVEGRRNRC
jgi:hypothetical protein